MAKKGKVQKEKEKGIQITWFDKNKKLQITKCLGNFSKEQSEKEIEGLTNYIKSQGGAVWLVQVL